MKVLNSIRLSLLCFAVVIVSFAICATTAKAQQGPPSITLNWNGVTVTTQSALSYKVQRATAQAGPFATIGTVTTTGYTDLTVTRGGTFYYQILSSCPASGAGCGTTASPQNGDSLPSNIVSGTVPNAATTPPIPTNLTITGVQ